MASLRKRRTSKGFVWVIDFTHKGKRVVVSTGTSNHQKAVQVKQGIEFKIASRKFNLEDLQREHPLASVFFAELHDYQKGLKAESTLYNELNIARAFVKQVGDVSLDQFSNRRIIDKWMAETLASVSPTTFNIRLRYLRAAFNIAVKWKYIGENPFTAVPMAKVSETRLYLLKEEFHSILKLVEADVKSLRVKRHVRFLKHFRQLVVFLINTGMRRKEAIRLARKDIDLESKLIHVVETKTKRSRIVPMNGVVVSLLSELDDDLFSAMNLEHVSRKFGVYVRRAGLQGFKLHSLRHTFATNLIAAGVDIYTVSKLLGHSDIRTTMIYAKADVQLMRNAVERIGSVEGGGKVRGDGKLPV